MRGGDELCEEEGSRFIADRGDDALGMLSAGVCRGIPAVLVSVLGIGCEM